VNSKTGVWKLGWAPSSITLVLRTLYNWGKRRLNILPVYTINSILVVLVYKGLINSKGFEF